ncbi:ATP-binding protein [Chloroflexota bacterium]
MVEKKYPINVKEVEAEYQELSGRMGFDGSKYLPRIIKKAFTMEQARLALAFNISNEETAEILGVSKTEVESNTQGYQVEALAKKLKLDKETVEQHIQYMFELGFAFPTRRGWRWARSFMQVKDSQTNPKFDEQLGDEYFDLWEAFQKIESYPTSYMQRLVASEQAEPRLRIIPARKSLKDAGDVVPEDDIEQVLKLYDRIAVGHCPCKRLVRDRACQSDTEVCLIFERIADHNIKRGAGRVISMEEALAIHDKSTAAGMVCMPQSNEAKPTLAAMICHCHWCCCDAIASIITMNYPFENEIAPSCYQSVVDPDKCTGCQICVTRCQFEAIQMKKYLGSGRQEKLKAWVDPDKCMGCGLCVITCPSEARTMVMVKAGDTIPRESAAPSVYTALQEHKRSKHMDTGSVMTRSLL